MRMVTIKQAESTEINWINLKYNEVDFENSNFDNEYIVVAKVGNENAGLGRLVKIDNENIELGGIYTFPTFRGHGIAEHIVTHLLNHNPFDAVRIWCLPFENIVHLYSKFGFKPIQNLKAPEKITQKLQWCNATTKYKEKVILLCKRVNT